MVRDSFPGDSGEERGTRFCVCSFECLKYNTQRCHSVETWTRNGGRVQRIKVLFWGCMWCDSFPGDREYYNTMGGRVRVCVECDCFSEGGERVCGKCDLGGFREVLNTESGGD